MREQLLDADKYGNTVAVGDHSSILTIAIPIPGYICFLISNFAWIHTSVAGLLGADSGNIGSPGSSM